MNRSKAEELIVRMKDAADTHPEFLAGVSQSLSAVDNCDPLYREFFGDFYDESSGFIQKMSTYLEEFRKGVFHVDSIKEAFRLSHMVKGASATMGYKIISSLAGGIESLFHDVKEGKMKLSPAAIDHVASAMSLVADHLEELKQANAA